MASDNNPTTQGDRDQRRQVAFYVRPEVKQQIQRIAQDEGRTVAGWLRRTVALELERSSHQSTDQAAA